MSFQLPEQYLRTDFTWGPPAEEMTIDGRPFELYFKSDSIQAIEWMRSFQDDNREEDEDEKYENRGVPREVEFKEVRNEARLNALRNERAKQSKLDGRRNKPRNDNQRNQFQNQRGKGKTAFKRRRIVELKSSVRLEPMFHAKFTQNDLAKSRMDRVPAATDLAAYGKPLIYNSAQDSASPKRAVPLENQSIKPDNLSACARATTLDDPHLRALIKNETGKFPCVVMTDEVMAMMMASAASAYPWHLQINKIPNRPIYFITKDEDSRADELWVSETAQFDVRPTEGDPMESESITNLAKESTLVQERFIRKSCTKAQADMDVSKGFPFPGTQQRMYRYRRFTVHPDEPNRYDIIVRTEIDAATPQKEGIRLFALLEHRGQTGVNKDVKDAAKLKSDWVENLEANSATYTAMEFRKNQFKMSRWIALSAISGAKYMKIGFITRDGFDKDNQRYSILRVHSDSPFTLATQLSVRLTSMWGTLDTLLEAMFNASELKDAVFAKPAGEYAVVLGEMAVESNEDEDEEDTDDDDEEDDEDDE